MGKQLIFNGECTWKPTPDPFSDDMMNLSGNAVKVYLYLAKQINIEKNNDDHVWPSYAAISEGIGIVNRNSISKAINELVERGWIATIKNPKKFNFQNNYTLNYIRKVNTALVAKRKKKSEAMSIAQKNRINNSDEGSVKNDTAGSNEIDTNSEGSNKNDTTGEYQE